MLGLRLEFNRAMVNQGLYLINLVRIGAPTPNHEALLHGTWYMDQGKVFGLWLTKASKGFD